MFIVIASLCSRPTASYIELVLRQMGIRPGWSEILSESRRGVTWEPELPHFGTPCAKSKKSRGAGRGRGREENNAQY
jgi:hypothetical protein